MVHKTLSIIVLASEENVVEIKISNRAIFEALEAYFEKLPQYQRVDPSSDEIASFAITLENADIYFGYVDDLDEFLY